MKYFYLPKLLQGNVLFMQKHLHLPRLFKFAFLSFAAIILFLPLAHGQVAVAPAAGDGSQENPYEIEILENLYWLSENPAAWDKHFIQTSVIDATDTETWNEGAGFSPIGNADIPFTGVYKGFQRQIAMLHMHWPDADNIGLFGKTEKALIHSVLLTSPKVKGKNNVGALVGFALNSEVELCQMMSVDVEGREYVGGLLGRAHGSMHTTMKIHRSHTFGSVKGTHGSVGGLVGMQYYGLTTNCYSMASVQGGWNVGGLIGLLQIANSNLVRHCYAAGPVEGGSPIGGLIGSNYTDPKVSVAGSFWDLETTGQETSAGGTGKATVQMHAGETYTNAGWPGTYVWNIGSGAYPSLSQTVKEPAAIEPDGEGSSQSPYLIATLENLVWLAENPQHWDKHYMQTDHINAVESTAWPGGSGLEPIGESNDDYFSGVYDGQNWAIRNLVVISLNKGTGMFGYMRGGEVKYLNLENVSVASRSNTGGLVGYSQGSQIQKCSVSGEVIGLGSNTGGLAGELAEIWGVQSVITRSHSAANVAGVAIAGGLVGLNTGNIGNSFSLGGVYGKDKVGGLVAVNSGTVLKTYAAASIDDQHASETGGLIAQNTGWVQNSFWDVDVSGQNESEGGEGLTTGQMKTESTFADAGWVFGTNRMWEIDQEKNHGYPFVRPTLTGFPAAPEHGDGSKGNPWQIATLAQLNWVSQNKDVWDDAFIQTADIDASSTAGWFNGEGFTPIGDELRDYWGYFSAFTGDYNGQGYKLENLIINKPVADNVGLFGFASRGVIRNVVLVNPDIRGHNQTGALLGHGGGVQISNSHTGSVHIQGHIRGNNHVGGVVGLLDRMQNPVELSAVSYSASWAHVEGESHVGGFAGSLLGSTFVSNCFALGNVTGHDIVGGFVGNNTSHVELAYASGAVTAQEQAGGFAALNTGTIASSFWDREATGQEESAGAMGKTTTEMQNATTYIEEGWNFDLIWRIAAGFINGYPTLITEGLVPEGEGTYYDPYQISTLSHLLWISQTSFSWGPNKHFVQVADIDASTTQNWDNGKGFSPIGNTSDAFRAVYDGQGHVISGLYINRPGQDEVGLFGRMQGVVKNLGLTDVDITGQDDAGAIAGNSSWGDIHHSYTTGTIIGNERVGGVAGYARDVNFSFSLCDVTGESHVGGLVGESRGIVRYSYAAGVVEGNTHVGGLAGSGGQTLHSFWDTESSGQSQSALGEGKTTAQMQEQQTFADAGWDFTWLWKLEAAENQGYPYFGPYVLPEVQAPQGGDGSEGNPWQIASLQQLAWVSLNPKSWEDSFVQVETIDASGAEGWFYGQGFAPIGNAYENFSGSYNGGGYVIVNLIISRPHLSYIGLFRRVYQAELSFIQLNDVSVLGYNNVGAVAGRADRTDLVMCYAGGEVEGYNHVGGVFGELYYSLLEQSVSAAHVKGNQRIGGLVGMSSHSTIENAYATGSVEGNSVAGGLAGRNQYADGSVVNSYSASIVKTGTSTGGLLGENAGLVEKSYWDTGISGQENSPGGEGKTTDEMILEITFEDWDFADIWHIEEGETYPYLQWQGVASDYNYPRSYYQLTLVVEPVDAGTAQEEGEYAEGSFVSLSAAAVAGYVFGWWADAEDNVISESAAYEYTMASDATTLTAHFTPVDYELNVQVSPAQGGNYEVSPEKEYYHVNDILTLTAIPSEGYELSEWKDHEMTPLGNEEVVQFTMPAQDAQLVLEFVLIDYNLTVHVNDDMYGSVIILPEKEMYNMGDEVTLTAIPNPGYAFELWEDADGETVSTETAYSFVMSAADAEYTARFKLKDLTFDVAVVPAGAGTAGISPEQDFYTMGQEIQLSVTAEDGYEFVSWNDVDGDVVSSQSAFTYTMGSENTLLEARFRLIDYALDVAIEPVDAGTVTLQPQQTHYNMGDEVLLTATENEGYEFIAWVNAGEDILSEDKVLNFAMPAQDVELTARFAPKNFTLTVSITDGSGQIDVTPEQEYYNMGDVIELKATPDDGYRFASWRDGQGNTLSTESEFTYTMPARNMTIFARFVLEQYTLDVQVEPSHGGYVNISPHMTHYNLGSNVMLSAEPYPGFKFARWKDEAGNELSTQESYSLTFPAADVVVWAEFEYVYYDFTVNVDPQGAGTVEVSPDRESFHVGEAIELKATAEEGWRFHSWRTSAGVAISSDEEFTYTMPSQSVNLVAYFEALQYEFQVSSTPLEAGYVEWVPGQFYHYVGDLISLYAYPHAGYEFLHWSDEQGEVLGTSVEMDFTMPGRNVSLTAHFDLMDLMLFLDAYPEAGGSIEASPVQEYYHVGDVVTLTAVPASNYIFLRWTDDEGHEISTHEVLEFVMPHHHTTVTAHFDLADSVEDLVEDGLRVYPNPARAQLMVETQGIARRIELLDAHGRMVKSLEPTSLLTPMDVSDLVSGMYIVRIVNDDGVVSRIIQVQQN